MCGTTNEDVYRIFMTGLDGSPMPSFADQLQPAEAWDLVHFLRTLQPAKSREAEILRVWLMTHPGELKPIGPGGGRP
jgi:mono/diheme cytochrome c family protein